MKIREVMSQNPACCLVTDSAQSVARIMCEGNVGSMPVVEDQQSRKLIGMITDRDLCCSVVSGVSCREGENVEHCERLMQEHQVRRIPIVDANGRVMGIVSQADLALKDKSERVSKTVAEISKNGRTLMAA